MSAFRLEPVFLKFRDCSGGVFKESAIIYFRVSFVLHNIKCRPCFLSGRHSDALQALRFNLHTAMRKHISNFAIGIAMITAVADGHGQLSSPALLGDSIPEKWQMPQRELFQIDIAFAVDEFDFFR